MAHGPAEELTGNRRYRSAIEGEGYMAEGVLVLQVEVSHWDYKKRTWACKWRDATPADLPVSEIV